MCFAGWEMGDARKIGKAVEIGPSTPALRASYRNWPIDNLSFCLPRLVRYHPPDSHTDRARFVRRILLAVRLAWPRPRRMGENEAKRKFSLPRKLVISWASQVAASA